MNANVATAATRRDPRSIGWIERTVHPLGGPAARGRISMRGRSRRRTIRSKYGRRNRDPLYSPKALFHRAPGCTVHQCRGR